VRHDGEAGLGIDTGRRPATGRIGGRLGIDREERVQLAAEPFDRADLDGQRGLCVSRVQ
jgi:hypothetical protein